MQGFSEVCARGANQRDCVIDDYAYVVGVA